MADRTFWEAAPGLVGELPDDLRRAVAHAGSGPASASLDACRAALAGWALPDVRVRLAFAPTIPYHCAPGFFRECRALADEHGIGIHSHLAESRMQAVVGRAKFGRSLTAHLDALGVLGSDFTAAHAVWVDGEDIGRLAARGANVAHNPNSNLRLGAGVAPVRRMLDAGVSVGIGTDASTCSDGLDMFEAMRLACYSSRIQSADPDDWLGVEEVLEMATLGSARALGLDARTGGLAPGWQADVVFLDLSRIQYLPLNHAARQVVFQETGTGVMHVMVGGRLVVRAGQVLTVDVAKLRADVERAVERIHARQARGARELVRRLEPIVGRFCVGLAKAPCPVHRYVGEPGARRATPGLGITIRSHEPPDHAGACAWGAGPQPDRAACPRSPGPAFPARSRPRFLLPARGRCRPRAPRGRKASSAARSAVRQVRCS